MLAAIARCVERFGGDHGAADRIGPGTSLGIASMVNVRDAWLPDGGRFGGAAWRCVPLEPTEPD